MQKSDGGPFGPSVEKYGTGTYLKIAHTRIIASTIQGTSIKLD